MNACIRLMVPADVDAVAAIERQCFSVPWSREAFVDESQNDLAHYFVTELDGEIVGYAGMWIILDEAHVTNIAVLPNHRGKSVGMQLMTELVTFAKVKGATSMTLEVRESNVAAQRLYQNLGFVPRGFRRNYYSDTGEGAVIMWRDPL